MSAKFNIILLSQHLEFTHRLSPEAHNKVNTLNQHPVRANQQIINWWARDIVTADTMNTPKEMPAGYKRPHQRQISCWILLFEWIFFSTRSVEPHPLFHSPDLIKTSTYWQEHNSAHRREALSAIHVPTAVSRLKTLLKSSLFCFLKECVECYISIFCCSSIF